MERYRQVSRVPFRPRAYFFSQVVNLLSHVEIGPFFFERRQAFGIAFEVRAMQNLNGSAWISHGKSIQPAEYADSTIADMQGDGAMDQWAWICQLAVAAVGVLVFLSLVADNLRLSQSDLAARKKVWDREQKNKREQEEAIQGETVPPVAMPSAVEDTSTKPAA